MKAGVEQAKAIEVKESADEIVEKLTAIENELVPTKSRGFQKPLNYPGQLYAQLAHLQSVFNGGFGAVDAPPTDGVKQRFEDLKVAIGDVFARLRQVLDTEVATLSEMVDGLNLPAVLVKEGTP